jgi:PAS domain S-box-containing protein
MDQDLSHWLHEFHTEIQCHWWATAREAGLVSETSLERLAQENSPGLGPFRQRLLACVGAASAPDPTWIEALTRELDQSDLLALLSALRQALFEFLVQRAEPLHIARDWPVLSQRIDRIGLLAADALDTQLAELDADRTHWQTLYNLTCELTSSIDLSYVLKNAVTRILESVDADRGAVFLLDSQTSTVSLAATQDWPDMTFNLADLPSDWQRGHGSSHVLTLDDVGDGIFQEFVRDRTETVIAAPLLANGQFHGILTIATSDSNGFDSRHLDLIDAAVIETLNHQARELGSILRQHQEEGSKRQAILASIADGVIFNNHRGQIVLVNRAAESILATRAEDLIGRDLKDLFDLFTAGAREEILEAMMIFLSNPQAAILPETNQIVLQIDNYTINAQWSPVITEQDGFLGIVTIFRDITREVEADRAKGEFVSTVSHELRTPMTAIKGYTDLLYSGMVGEINDNQKRFLGIIRNNADRLTALISDLLDIDRVETGRVRFEPEPLQIGDIVKNVIDALAPSAETKQHVLAFRIEAGLPEIMGDRDRLNQVFTNLVGNAINYTPDGGKISVDVYSVGGAVRADVRDNGIGIRSEDLGKIFERFYRADHPLVQESRGTGLGLPIVKMFVEMHGGRVWAESEVGKGSSFTVLLPQPTTGLQEGLERIPLETLARLPKGHVLVADDDPDIAELVKLHLEETGFRAVVVGRGVKVLEIARRQRPDLIVLDVLLPDMDGRAVLEALKSDPATADIPVIMLTVLADDGTAFELGAADFLTKPIEAEKLIEAVQTALSRRGRILVVEDDVDTIEIMRLALRRVGYSVDVAADGYEALSLARRWQPQAIVLDLRLPGMDGYETLSHLKRNQSTQRIPIVVTSGHVANSEQEIRRLKSIGVESFLPKPFTVSQLVKAIDQVTGTI